MSSGSFWNVIMKMCLQIIYIQYICINRIWHLMTYNGWYAIKPNQPTDLEEGKLWIQNQEDKGLATLPYKNLHNCSRRQIAKLCQLHLLMTHSPLLKRLEETMYSGSHWLCIIIIIVEIRLNQPSSNPGWSCWHFTLCLFFWERHDCIPLWLFGFYGISTFVSYLMPNPFLYK